MEEKLEWVIIVDKDGNSAHGEDGTCFNIQDVINFYVSPHPLTLITNCPQKVINEYLVDYYCGHDEGKFFVVHENTKTPYAYLEKSYPASYDNSNNLVADVYKVSSRK